MARRTTTSSSARPSANKQKRQSRPASPALRPAQALPLRLGWPGIPLAVGERKTQAIASAAVPGDRLNVRLTGRLVATDSSEGNSARASAQQIPLAEVLNVADPSPDRGPYPCPVVQQCGGCSLQEMTYPAQLDAKSQALADLAVQLGLRHSQPPQVTGLTRPFGYRTTLMMVSGGRAGELRCGFYRRGSAELVNAEGCAVQHPLTLATLAMTRQVLDAAGIAPTTTRDESGWLHAIRVRVSPANGTSELTLVGKSPQVPGKSNLAARLATLPGVSGVHLCVTPTRSSYPSARTSGAWLGRGAWPSYSTERPSGSPRDLLSDER